MRPRDPKDYLELGDRLRQRGNRCLAARAYSLYADACLGAPLLARARALATTAPLEALAALTRVESLLGPTADARAVAARAYESLGELEIAAAFRSVK